MKLRHAAALVRASTDEVVIEFSSMMSVCVSRALRPEAAEIPPNRHARSRGFEALAF
jgi:hypothetical protein